MSKLEPTRTYSNPTATEVLRRLLDERGVEWHDTKIGKGFITVFEHDGITWIVTEHSSGRLSVKGCVKPTQGHYDGMTPEQAIAATLGVTDARPTQAESSGTCHIKPWKMEHDTGFFDCMECSECGYVTDVSEWAKATYCAGCGRRVEQ